MSRQPPQSVRHLGRTLRIQRELQFKGRRYWLTRKLGRPERSHWQVYDPAARALRTIQELPDSPAARQQISALRRLERHAGAVPAILDCELKDNRWRVLTTWVEGQSLAAYLQAARSGAKPWPSVFESVRLIRGFVHGLCQFYQFTGSIHGDISPANLIVQAQPLALTLIDYGSAWPIERAAGRLLGEGATPGYAAPERLVERAAISLADQFSTGVIFYEMLTGKLPYEGMGGRAGLSENLTAFVNSYEPPSKQAVDHKSVPPAAWQSIDALAERMLRLDVSERHVSSRDWRAAADRAWDTVRLPAHRSPFIRIGEVIAAWFEGMGPTRGK